MPRPATVDHESALNSALDLFWRRGYRDVSVDDVTRETGLNRHALYGRYQSKYGLAVVVLQRYCAEGTSRLQAILRGPGSPRERLQRLLHLRDPDCTDPFWRCMQDRGCLAMRLVADIKDTHPEVGRIVAGTLTSLAADVTAVVREGQERGEFRLDRGPDELATTIIAAWSAALAVPEAYRKGVALAALN